MGPGKGVGIDLLLDLCNSLENQEIESSLMIIEKEEMKIRWTKRILTESVSLYPLWIPE